VEKQMFKAIRGLNNDQRMRAFFDETGTHQGHRVTAVAGFLYDGSGLAKFETQWRKRTADPMDRFTQPIA
jgi:hypothetical protein